jgi:hypothetical protein
MSEMIVRFNTRNDGQGRDLRLIAGPAVKAVIRLASLDEQLAFMKAHGIGKRVKNVLPQGSTLMEATRDKVIGSLKAGERGPADVCYWVDGTLICWSDDEE